MPKNLPSISSFFHPSALQTKTDPCANSVNPDKTAHYELSHKDLLFAILFLSWDWNPYLQQWICPNSRMEEPT